VDGSGPKFFSLIDSVLGIALAAYLLAAGPRALAETGAIMIAIGQMKLGSTRPSRKRVGSRSGPRPTATRFDEMTVTMLP
jgi:hypothetical protein